LRSGEDIIIELGFLDRIGSTGGLHLHGEFRDLLGLSVTLLFLVHFNFSFRLVIFFRFVHGNSVINFLSDHIMESRSVGGDNMDLIGGGGLRNSLLGDSNLFDGESGDTNSSVRGVDGHGVQGLHGDLFGLVLSSDHLVSGDLGLGSMFLEDHGGFSSEFFFFSGLGSVFLGLFEKFGFEFGLFE